MRELPLLLEVKEIASKQKKMRFNNSMSQN